MAEYKVASTVKKEGLAGILAALLGNIPDETLTALLNEGIRGLSIITPAELEKMRGIGRDKALRLLAAIELAKLLAITPPGEKYTIRTSEDAARLVMEEMRYLDREQFRVIHLDSKNRVIGQEVISIGSLNASTVHPREVFKNAIKASAATIIAIHNHPSGDPIPSREDIEIAKRLNEAGSIIGIEVLDHLVIGNGRFESLRAKRLV